MKGGVETGQSVVTQPPRHCRSAVGSLCCRFCPHLQTGSALKQAPLLALGYLAAEQKAFDFRAKIGELFSVRMSHCLFPWLIFGTTWALAAEYAFSWWQHLQMPHPLRLGSIPEGTRASSPLGSGEGFYPNASCSPWKRLPFKLLLHRLSVETDFLTPVSLSLRFPGFLSVSLLHPHPAAGSTAQLFQFSLKKCQ